MLELRLCRLCLGNNNLIDVFYSRKLCTGANYLHSSILLTTGVNILPEDKVTKYVCKACCDLCLKLFEFRKIALANDRALQHICDYVSTNIPEEITEVTALNELSYKNSDVTIHTNNDNEYLVEPVEDDYAIHPTVYNILKTYKGIILPDEVLKLNLNPSLVLDAEWENVNVNPQRKHAIDDTEASPSDEIDLNPVTNVNDSNPPPPTDRPLYDLLEVAREEVVVRKSQRKRKKCCKKSHVKAKKTKEDEQVLLLSDKLLSLSLHDIISAPQVLQEHTDGTREKTFTYEMFLQPMEVSFLKSSFLQHTATKISEGVNTYNISDFTVQPNNSDFTVVTNLSTLCSTYRIPVVYQYEQTNEHEISFIVNKKEKEPDKIQLWDQENIIDLQNNRH